MPKARSYNGINKRLDRERRIQRAIKMYRERDDNGKRKYSMTIAGELNGIKYGQLRLRLGGGKNGAEGHRGQH